MKDSRRILVFAGVILVLALGVITMTSTTGEAKRSKELFSSFNNRDCGIKAFYLLLKESGFPVFRWRKKMEGRHFASERDVFIIASPNDKFSDSELDSLRMMVTEGHTAVLFNGRASQSLMKAFQIETLAGQEDSLFYSSVGDPHVPDTLLFSQVDSFDRAPDVLQVDSADFSVLYRAGERKAVVEFKYGQGEVIAFNSANYIANANICKGNNVRVVMNVLHFAADGNKRVFNNIYVDEFHQGFHEFESLVAALDEGPVKLGVTMSLAALLLWIYSKSKRFGRIVPVMDSPRRASMGHVDSVTNVYMEAHAYPLVLQIWRRWVMKFLSDRYRTNLDKKLAYQISQRFNLKESELLRLFLEVDRKLLDAQEAEVDTIRKREVPIDEKEFIILCKRLDMIYSMHLKRVN